MASVDDDMREDSTHTVMNPLILNLDEETLSSKDLAWADSCLNKDVYNSGADWSSIKDALLEILSAQPGPPATSSAAQSSTHLAADEILRYRENLMGVEYGGGSDKEEDLIDDDFGEGASIDVSEDDLDDLIFRNKRGRVRGKKLVNVFRPNYSEDGTAENLDSGSALDWSMTMYQVDPSQEDIFKVWDLGTSDEQDDFTKQLDKALADAPSQIQSNTNDSTAVKDMMHVSVDDLVAGIGDLSLKQNIK